MNNKLIVSNFHPNTTEDDLKEIFREYGLVNLFLKPGKYAVLTFEEDWGAAEAKEVWGKAMWWGYWLRIKYAEQPDEHPRRVQRKRIECKQPRWEDDDD